LGDDGEYRAIIDTIDWNPLINIRISENALPAIFVQTPANMITVDSREGVSPIEFSWVKTVEADEYILKFSRTRDFSDVIYSKNVGDVDNYLLTEAEFLGLPFGKYNLYWTIEPSNAGLNCQTQTRQIAVINAPTTPLPPKVGSWLFEDPNILEKATIGNDLVAYKMAGNKTTGSPNLDGFISVDGPTPGSHAVRIPKQSYFFCNHGIAPKPLENKVNEFTLLIDFKVGTRASFLQTDLTNNNDVDIFMRPNMTQIGIVGYYADLDQPVQGDKWYRLIISAKFGEGGYFIYYLNGKQIYKRQGPNFLESLTALDSERTWNKAGVLLFADEDGEDEVIDVAEVAIWDVAMDEVTLEFFDDLNH
jgi:hypothetical protein